jgi:hypothetical protein
MLEAFGFSSPPDSIRQFVTNILKLRGKVVKMLPAKTQPDFYVDSAQRSYPKGYKMTDLGPPHMLDSLNRPSE